MICKFVCLNCCCLPFGVLQGGRRCRLTRTSSEWAKVVSPSNACSGSSENCVRQSSFLRGPRPRGEYSPTPSAPSPCWRRYSRLHQRHQVCSCLPVKWAGVASSSPRLYTDAYRLALDSVKVNMVGELADQNLAVWIVVFPHIIVISPYYML